MQKTLPNLPSEIKGKLVAVNETRFNTCIQLLFIRKYS